MAMSVTFVLPTIVAKIDIPTIGTVFCPHLPTDDSLTTEEMRRYVEMHGTPFAAHETVGFACELRQHQTRSVFALLLLEHHRET